ncbi:MAG: YidC/Oxa1 family membrane protein insertase [Eubacterium sp.]|nr:YidC/Oxa1 family membrane protein insertase [Eubacterium sp.]
MLLTQSTIPIIGWIATLMGFIMKYIYQGLDSVGIQNIGLCIIIFTIIIRILMLPLMIRQQKFTKINSAMQPEIQKIQKKYRGKKDQASMMKQNEEIQAVYDKYGTNMTGGCAQLLVQFPVLLALYQVIRKPPAYIPQVKAAYMTVVNALTGQSGYIGKINEIAETLKSSYVSTLANDATSNKVIDVLTYFNSDCWSKLADAFPSVSDTINTASAHIVKMNDFALGINITQTPGWHPSIYWIIPILAGLFQYLSFKTMQQPDLGDNSAAGMTKSMSLTMPLMSVYFCLIMPAGLGLYWVVSAVFQCIQQIAINKYLEGADMDAIIEKNREKAAKKKAKGRKSLMDRLMNPGADSGQAGADSDPSRYSSTGIKEIANMNLKKMSGPSGFHELDPEAISAKDIDSLGEISKNAYLVAKYEKEHNARGGKK